LSGGVQDKKMVQPGGSGCFVGKWHPSDADLEDLEEELEHEVLGATAAVEPCYFFLVLPSSIDCRNE
jgi:hypothetical protein